jgi:hypothetical protein
MATANYAAQLTTSGEAHRDGIVERTLCEMIVSDSATIT